jgi:MFS family permease
MADKIGRRKVMILTALNFSVPTGLMALTPDNGWLFLSVCRFFVGLGVTSPKATLDALVPTMNYFGFWFVLAALAAWFLGFETRGRTIQKIDGHLKGSMRVKPS